MTHTQVVQTSHVCLRSAAKVTGELPLGARVSCQAEEGVIIWGRWDKKKKPAGEPLVF